MPSLILGFLSRHLFVNIMKSLTNPFQFPDITLPIAKVQEVLVPIMGALHAAKVLDRTPVLLRPSRNLCHVVQDAIGISAILTVDLLDQVEIGKMVTVKSEIVGSTHRGNTVNREADPLVGRADEIH